MKKIAIILVAVLLCCAAFSLTACDNNQVKITVNGKSFVVELADTKAAAQFVKALPMTLEMHSVNGQLYADMPDKTFSEQHDSSNPMVAGDIVLEGNNRLVMFYVFGNVNPTMTRIGKVREEDTDAFVAALTQAVQNASGGKVTVKISK